MVKYVDTKKGFRARFVCDACGKQIKSGVHASVYWREGGVPVFAHNGGCGLAIDDGRYPYCEPLEFFALCLLNSAGMRMGKLHSATELFAQCFGEE